MGQVNEELLASRKGEGLGEMEERLTASLVKESCNYMALGNIRHPGMAHRNSLVRRNMASDRQRLGMIRFLVYW